MALLVTNKEITDFQENHWVSYLSQQGVYLECNLKGNFRVRSGVSNTIYSDLEEAKNKYLEILDTLMPEYKISIKFEK